MTNKVTPGLQLGEQPTDMAEALENAQPAEEVKQQRPTASEATDFDVLMGDVDMTTSLSEEAEDFNNELLKLLQKADSGFEMSRVPDRNLDVYAVTYKKTAILLLFSETFTSGSTFIPMTHPQLIGTPIKTVSGSGARVIDAWVVGKEDLDNIKKWAQILRNTLKAQVAPNRLMNINTFSRREFDTSHDLNDVEDAFRKLYPKEVLPRIDCGIVIYRNSNAGNNDGALRNIPGKMQPVAVVTAYTKFGVRDSHDAVLNNDTKRIVPVVTISGIMSPFMNNETLAMALPVAVEEFIRYNGWLRPYTKFGKKDLNLGCLIPNDKGVPGHVKDRNELDRMMQMFVTKPHLAIDIADGLPRIPGIASLVDGGQAIKDAICNFLNVDTENGKGELTLNKKLNEYIGVFGAGIDTRSVDFPGVMKSGPSDPAAYVGLLDMNPDPEKRIELIAKHFDDVRALYNCTTVVFNDKYLESLSASVAKTFRPVFERRMTISNDIGNLGLGGNEWGTTPIFQNDSMFGSNVFSAGSGLFSF